MTNSVDRLYEQVLVLRCQAGDEAAFAELVQLYQPRLSYYLRKMLRNVHDAEDILQLVWLDVFRSVPRLVEAGAFRSWLYRIARDRALRELRKHRPAFQPLAEEELPADAAREEEFTAEDAEVIHTALVELPPEHREVIVLRYVEEMTYEEMARVVGCQVGTVRSRLHYAKRALRQLLERIKEISHE